MARYIISASVSLELGEEFEGPPRTITFAPPKDHPALLELWHWHVEQLLAEVKKADGSGDLFF